MKIFLKITMLLTIAVTTNVFAGNGSGNPKNDPYNSIKFDTTPRFIWKDGKLVGNPNYITYKGNPADVKK